MQPYFLPYIGYFQLIAASDLFVIYDEAQYMKGGWVNRNRILLNGEAHWLTLPVEHSPIETPIDRKRYQLSPETVQRLKQLLRAAYGRAPMAASGFALVDEILAFPDLSVARFNEHALRAVCRALGIGTTLVRASELDRDRSLRGREAVVDIATRVGATRYLNAPGGIGLYEPEPFAERGMSLNFLMPRPSPYMQFADTPLPNLSILDELMFCDASARAQRLAAFDIVTPAAEERRRA